ncbi:hypothetical protein KEM54_000435, partial [Ascosphaera aggregata]
MSGQVEQLLPFDIRAMDAYPKSYVDHNLPFICISGIDSPLLNVGNHCAVTSSISDVAGYPQLHEQGLKIHSDFPLLTSAAAGEFLAAISRRDGSKRPWNSLYEQDNDDALRLRIEHTGRVFLLPPQHGTMLARETARSSIAPLPHSPISPLSPTSPIFPDGIMTSHWVSKHHLLVPAAVVNCFSYTTDLASASLNDNQLKIEINALKQDWIASGFKTRFFVALIGDDGPLHEDVTDRLANIRRSTGMDAKSLFFFPSKLPKQQIEERVDAMLYNIQTAVLEYYRDLSKHARRKRNRSSIPPPSAPPTTGTSQILTAQGWNIRYEFKLGVFAEFRQEMDTACRCYESAYDNLFTAEIFESIAGWTSRFDEARMLADVLALRIIRCLLWLQQSGAAVRAWSSHRDEIRSIVTRRGKGTKNYGFEAWEQRWSLIMAELIDKAEVFADETGSACIYAPLEKNVPALGKVRPWELLHHQGYWIYRSIRHAKRRRKFAESIPTEDRQPIDRENEGRTRTAQVTMYDTYLVGPPHEEYPLEENANMFHARMIVKLLQKALSEFDRRGQTRIVEQLSLDLATELVKLRQWQDGLRLLKRLWNDLSWRKSGWWSLMQRFASTLRECAVKCNDLETVLRIDWELLNRTFDHIRGSPINIQESLRDCTRTEAKPAVVFKGEDSVSCLSASLAFAKAEGHVGEPLLMQLIISSCASPTSSPISLSQVKIVFEGGIRPIKLEPDPASASSSEEEVTPHEILEVSLEDSATVTTGPSASNTINGLKSVVGATNLTFAPGQVRAFNLMSIPREAGEARPVSISLIVDDPTFNIDFVVMKELYNNDTWWKHCNNGIYPAKIGKSRNPTIVRVLPKPPKVKLTTPSLREHYYTDERIKLQIDVENTEDSVADIALEFRLLSTPDTSIEASWNHDACLESPEANEATDDQSGDTAKDNACRCPVGAVQPGDRRSSILLFTNTFDAADHEVEISAYYTLKSDPETLVFTTCRVGLSLTRPFEANYEIMARLDPEPWPSFFSWNDSGSGEEQEGKLANPGLRQRWCLNVKMVSFAMEPLIIEDVAVAQLGTANGCMCTVGPEHIVQGPYRNEIHPEELRVSEFDVEIQRLALDDRRTTCLNLALGIRWRRRNASPDDPPVLTTTTLAMPRFFIALGEPRVLASAVQSSDIQSLMHLTYTFENPSMHYLTFDITMEASDQFSFSGPKKWSLQLVPQNRVEVNYKILVNTQGAGQWIQPNLIVVDSYFNKTLNVLATEKMRTDKNGILIWVEGS